MLTGLSSRFLHPLSPSSVPPPLPSLAPHTTLALLSSGADDEVAIRRSRSAYSDYEMHYDVLAGNSPDTLDLSTKIFGRNVSLPFFMCPTAGHRMFHTIGERATSSVAAEKGMLFGLSSLSTVSIREIAAEQPKDMPKVFQLYLWKDKGLNRDLLAAARESGYDAVALTADFSWFGNRERDRRNGFSVLPNYSAQQVVEAIKKPAWTWDLITNDVYTYSNINQDVPAESLAAFINKQLSPDFNWDDAEWLAGEWGGKFSLKGVVRPDNAVKALRHGFDSIWVSNHGGRQLETAPPTINVLPEIRAAVGPSVEIILDGGVMRGTDIAKGLALGADSVGIGKVSSFDRRRPSVGRVLTFLCTRPRTSSGYELRTTCALMQAYLYGLAAGGSAGVAKSINILEDELRRAMGLLGTRTVEELKRRGPDLIRHRHSLPLGRTPRARAV